MHLPGCHTVSYQSPVIFRILWRCMNALFLFPKTYMGILSKQMTTCTDAMMTKILAEPYFTSQPYAPNVNPKLKIFLKISRHVNDSTARSLCASTM